MEREVGLIGTGSHRGRESVSLPLLVPVKKFWIVSAFDGSFAWGSVKFVT